jgi:hypothetical protein
LFVKTCNSSTAKLLAVVLADPIKEAMMVVKVATAHRPRPLNKDAPWVVAVVVTAVVTNARLHSSAHKHSLNVRLQPTRMTLVKGQSLMVWKVTTFLFDRLSCASFAQP